MNPINSIPLGEACTIVGGGTPSRAIPEYFQGELPWATVKDFKNHIIADTEEHITDSAVAGSAANVVDPGTVLLVSRVGLGKVAIAGTRMAINQDIKALTPKPGISTEYMFWFLLSKASAIQKMGAGATVKGITLNDIKAISFPVPHMDEQLSIVDVLSRADSIVRLRRDATKKAAELIPAFFNSAFGDPATNPKGWPASRFGDVLASVDYGSSSKASDEVEGLPMIRMGNVRYDGSLDLANLKYVTLAPDEVGKYRLVRGDILFNRTNSKELVGKTGIWDGSCDAIIASYFIRLRADTSRLNPFYLWAFMNTPHMKRTLFATARGAIGQANINSKELRAFPLPLPPLALQNAFESQCTRLADLAAQMAVASEKAIDTFDALLGRTFNAAAH